MLVLVAWWPEAGTYSRNTKVNVSRAWPLKGSDIAYKNVFTYTVGKKSP